MSGLKISTMLYVAVKDIYLNDFSSMESLYKAIVGFAALNGINMIPSAIINDAINYFNFYYEATITESNVCNLGLNDSLLNDEF